MTVSLHNNTSNPNFRSNAIEENNQTFSNDRKNKIMLGSPERAVTSFFKFGLSDEL